MPFLWTQLDTLCPAEVLVQPTTPAWMPNASLFCWHIFFTDYPHGITLVTPVSGSEKKQVLHFCALGAEEMQKFVEDLKESIAEVTELEQIRIECKGL